MIRALLLVLLSLPAMAQMPMGGITVAGGGGGGGAPSFVKACSSVSSSNDPASVSCSNTAGNSVVVCFGAWNAATSFVISETGQSNTWTAIDSTTDGTGQGTGSKCWIATAVTGGADTINVSPGVTTRTALMVLEFTGSRTSDQHTTSNNQTGATINVGPTGTTTAANEAVVAFAYAFNQSGIVFSAGTGYTIPTNGSINGSANSAAVEYKIVSATGTQSASFPVSGQTGDPVQMILLTIK